MSFPTIRFLFDRRKKSGPDKPGYVEIEIYHQRRRKYINTGVSILPSQWSNEGKVKNHPMAFALNRQLEEAAAPIRKHIQLVIQRGEEFSLSSLSQDMKRADHGGSFVDYVENRIKERKDIREITRKKQRKIVTALREFSRIQTFSDVTTAKIRAFDSWLRTRTTNNNTINAYHRLLRTYVNMAIAEGLLAENPYLGVKVPRQSAATIRYLDAEEIARIEAVETEDRTVMKVRDLFLFQCYTGMAYGDVSTIDFTQLEKKDGKYFLNRRRHKTGVPFRVVLLSPAVRILEKYRFRLPLMTNQKYNIYLKSLAAYAGLRCSLTSHCGRHSFATFCLNNGVSLEILKEMMGHTDIKTTELYAKMLDNSVKDAFSELEKKIANN